RIVSQICRREAKRKDGAAAVRQRTFLQLRKGDLGCNYCLTNRARRVLSCRNAQSCEPIRLAERMPAAVSPSASSSQRIRRIDCAKLFGYVPTSVERRRKNNKPQRGWLRIGGAATSEHRPQGRYS